MMKFFRKYTKTLLAVFMALLLVVWLGGQALQNLFDRQEDFSQTVIGKAFGQDVTQGDLARVQNEGEIGARLMRFWSMPWVGLAMTLSGGDMQRAQSMLYQMRRDPLTLEEWYMLDAETQQNHVRVAAEQVADYRSSLPASVLTAVRDQQKLSIDQIDSVIRMYLRVEEAAMQGASAVEISEADIRDFIRQTGEKVQVKLVVVDPTKLEDANYQPGTEEIQAQFDKYKDKVPAGPGQFGYQLPEATEIEYIQIRIDELAKSQIVSDDDAHKYWEDHKDEFKRPTSQPASAPTTRPEQPKPYEYFADAAPSVFKKLQRDKATKAANTLASELIRKLQAPWASQPTTQPGNYRQPPTSEMAEDVYRKLAESQVAKSGPVLLYDKTALLSSDNITISPIGPSSAFAGSPQRVPFSEVGYMVAGLKADKSANPAHARLFRNLYETCAEPVTNMSGDVFVFRNVAIRPAQAPASVDEVKDKVVSDLRHIKAYAEAEKVARDLAERAKSQGLKAAFQGDAALATKLGNNALADPPPFARKMMFSMGGMPQLYDGSIPGVGQDPELMTLCFDLAGRTTATQPAPVAVHEQSSRQRWVVVEFDKLVPLTRDEYNKQREQARGLLLGRKRLEFISSWFDHDQIVARTGWQEVRPVENGDETPADEEKKPEQAAK